MLTAMAGATALYRCTLGEVLGDPARAEFHMGLVRECAAEVRAEVCDALQPFAMGG